MIRLSFRRARARGFSQVLSCEMMERRRLLCGLPHDLLPAAPEFDWGIEAAEAARLAAENPGEGGPEAVSIVWTNRGQITDNFAAVFGTMANQARAVVDAAIDDWERVITNWNRSDGTTTLQVTILVAGTGYGGSAIPAATAPADGKPRTGSIILGAGEPANFPDPNDSNGWYIDPTPTDSAEFPAIINAFAGRGDTSLG
ncbi:MAG: hypothetical protein NZ561_11875, partial [Phycisphaerae bacterium]|nr:hypothetical protein [Phycisphaerae bacterium]MDW8262306.1 hypothetical protein [Phycisphaerales bacterium]